MEPKTLCIVLHFSNLIFDAPQDLKPNKLSADIVKPGSKSFSSLGYGVRAVGVRAVANAVRVCAAANAVRVLGNYHCVVAHSSQKANTPPLQQNQF